jgi:DNA-binding transcriptional ArsR family regulator
MDEQAELWEELKVENLWFHVLRSVIARGGISTMGVNAWAVYCVLKNHTDLNTGKTFPGREKIAELIGASEDTVDRALSRLAELGIAEKQKEGRKNVYHLVEKVPMTSSSGDLAAHAQARYVPMAFETVMDDIKEFAQSGKLPANAQFKIIINANFIQQAPGSVVNYQVGDGATLESKVENPPKNPIHRVNE